MKPTVPITTVSTRRLRPGQTYRGSHVNAPAFVVRMNAACWRGSVPFTVRIIFTLSMN